MTAAQPAVRARLDGADLLRCVAAVAVIMIHASAWPGYAPAWTVVDRGTRFAVPAFVVLTGLVLSYSYRDRSLGWSFLRRRFARTLLPFAVWAPFYLLLGIWRGAIRSSEVATWIQGGAGHLYFLLIVPQLYLLFCVWPRRHRWWLATAALVIQLGISAARLYLSIDSYWWDYFTLWYGVLYFPYWIGYFAVGIAIGGELRLPQSWRLPGMVLAAGLAVASMLLLLMPAGGPQPAYATGTGTFIAPLMSPFALSLAALLLLAGPPVLARLGSRADWIRRVGRDSLGIYIIHPAVIVAIQLLIGDRRLSDSVSSAPGFIAFVAVLLAISLALTRAISAGPLAPIVGAVARRGPAPSEGDVAVAPHG